MKKTLITLLLASFMLTACGDPVEGAKGLKGLKGQPGEQGEKGPQGEKGEQGEKGPTGAKGQAGYQGVPGETGDKGPQGEQGPVGDQGDQGDQGLDGGYPVIGINELGNWVIDGKDTGVSAFGPAGVDGGSGGDGGIGEKGDDGELTEFSITFIPSIGGYVEIASKEITDAGEVTKYTFSSGESVSFSLVAFEGYKAAGIEIHSGEYTRVETGDTTSYTEYMKDGGLVVRGIFAKA